MAITPTIPASAIANAIAGVLSAGGTALDLNGLCLTTNIRVPIGTVQNFSGTADVNSFFGSSSDEAAKAAVYFAGFNNRNAVPASLLFAQYNQIAVPAYLRGGSIAALTLTQLQALVGTLTIVVGGQSYVGGSISLSAVTSFSDAANTIQSALNAAAPQLATCTLGTIAGTVLTVAGTLTGTFGVGQHITGSGITANTIITSLGTGTGGAGTYNLSQSSTVGGAESMVASAPALTVAYDSVSGALTVTGQVLFAPLTIAFATGTLAAGIKWTSATGAVLSQGAAAAVPATAMDAIKAQTTNWATFFSLFDPDGGSGNTVKQAFAAWTNAQGRRYAYTVWDTDITPGLSNNAPSSLGNILEASESEGSIVIYAPDATLAAFTSGTVASIDFTEHNGRITLAFKSQGGLTPSVTDKTFGDNLIANGYNFYGAYATANDQFVFFYPGQITGAFEWADSYINQIWLNNQFQLAMMVLETQIKSLPYNNDGYGLIRACLMDPIQQGLDFGAFAPGVPLSALQAAEVKSAVGFDISGILFAQGWYLQIKPALPQVRAVRKSPPMTFYYNDAGSIQQLVLNSIEIQ